MDSNEVATWRLIILSFVLLIALVIFGGKSCNCQGLDCMSNCRGMMQEASACQEKCIQLFPPR